jgi:hypothetical protein
VAATTQPAAAPAPPTTRPAGVAAARQRKPAKAGGDGGAEALAAVARGARTGARIPPAILQRLRGTPASTLAHPVAVGDGLFRSGQHEAALVFYELAMRHSTEPAARAWLLFQIGNCQRRTDPAAAAKAYQQLIRDFPDSPWSPVAKMLDRVVQWRLLNKPDQVLAGLSAPGR